MEQWAALVAVEIVYLTARVGRAVSAATVTTFDLASWTSHRRPVLRQPGCERCCPLPAGGHHPLSDAYRTEQAGLLPAPELVELAERGPRPTRHWPRLPLRVQPRPAAPSPAATPLDSRILESVVDQALGRAETRDLAPAGGPAVPLAPISPVQAYLRVHGVKGLPSGWHWWNGRDGGFVPLGLHLEDGVVGAPGAGVGGMIVLTTARPALVERHGALGHRLAYLATGRVAWAVVDGLARAGFPAELRTEWDQASQASAIGLDPAEEPLAAVIDVAARTVTS
jgi:hypothetical protein